MLAPSAAEKAVVERDLLAKRGEGVVNESRQKFNSVPAGTNGWLAAYWLAVRTGATP
jgi:hypothetical protein